MGLFDDIPAAQAQSQGINFDNIEAPNAFEQVLARITLPKSAEWGLNRARGFVMGAADPVVGAAQLAAHAVGSGDGIDKAITAKEQQYEADRKAVGSDGFDAMRLAGNVASPVNLAAARIPLAATTLGKVGQGAAIGGASGLAQPVIDGNFAGTKIMQGITGAALGGALAPFAARIGEAVARKVEDPAIAGARATLQTDQIIDKALQDIGQSINDLPPGAIANLRAQVRNALKEGKQLDPAAILRLDDFKAAGIPALQGQVTRDPMQFAQELNLRGVAGVGEPIAARLSEQNRLLQKAIGDLRSGADESFNAGVQVSDALKGADEAARRRVSGLYAAARGSAGKDLDVPLQGLAQDYADVLSRFGDKVPSGVRNQFAALGLDPATPSNQQRLFTIENADKLLKVINDNVGADVATNRALTELRNAIKNSVLSVDATGGPFAPAVKAAAQRFKMHELVPALKAAAEGSVPPDDFVRRFVLNGKANDMGQMAKVLKAFDPAAFDQARAQIGADLYRAAFGADVVGTKGFAAERFNKRLMDYGSARLNAFFSPDEISQLRRLGRVGAYIHQEPSGAAVNRSNTAGALMNLMQRIPGAPAVVSAGNAARNAINNHATVRSAVNPVAPITKAALSPEQQNALAALLSGGAAVAGGIGGAFFR